MAINSVRTSHGTIWVSLEEISYSIATNTSYVKAGLSLSADAGWGPSHASGVDWAVGNNFGQVSGWSGSFDLSVGQGGSQQVAVLYATVPHAADGTASISVTGSIGPTGTQTFGSGGNVSVNLTLTTIPRVSHPTVEPTSADAGDTVTIHTNRASASFTHTISYAFGSATGTIATKTTNANPTWTVPLSLLEQIPDSTSAACAIVCKTYSGSTYIGQAQTSLTITVPASVKPTIASITDAEATGEVASKVGAYVQSLSTLALTIQGAAGAYGSTIKSSSLSVGSQVIDGDSGTTDPINVSGTVQISATVVDSRGRTATATKQVTVLPYAMPQIDTYEAQRADADGTLNDDGTHFKVSLDGSVKSLVNGTEKNSLTYIISTREHGTTSWTQQSQQTPDGLTFNSSDVIGTFDIEQSWDVLIQVSDIFATSAKIYTVPTAAIFMHWDASTGVGIGKYRTQGVLDVAGDIYQNDEQVLDESSGWTRTDADSRYDQTTDSIAASRLSGTIDAARLPEEIAGKAYAIAAGIGSNAASAYGAITFPTGRFTQPPLVFGATYGAVTGAFNVQAASVTTSGCNAAAFNPANNGAVAAHWYWVAIQMTADSATG